MLLGNTENNARANVSMGTIGSMQIPLPSLEEQEEIVSSIESEQQLVNSNKEVVQIFEQKIKDRIAEVWGEKSEP